MFDKIFRALAKAFMQCWKNKYKIAAVCLVLALALSITNYYKSSSRASANISLNYAEASLGLNPNRTRFDINEFKSTAVMERAIQKAGLSDDVSPDKLASCISLSAVDPVNASSSSDYINTTYHISFVNHLGIKNPDTATLFQILCSTYKDYFMENYGDNQGLLTNEFPDFFEDEPFLRLKSLSMRAEQINRYVSARVRENESYTDEESGQSFLMISKELQNVIDYDIPTINSFILKSGLAQNRDRLISTLNYKVKIEDLEYQRQMAFYNSDKNGINLYDRAMSAIVMIPTIDEMNEFYMSKTKIAIDKMAKSADSCLEEATSYQSEIEDTKYIISSMRTGGDAQRMEKVTNMLDNLSDNINTILENLRTVDASFIKYKTQNYLMFNDNVTSFSQQIKARTVVRDVFGFLVLCFLFFLAKTLTKKGTDNKHEEI